MSDFWSAFVILLTVANMVACLWLLLWTARRAPGEPDKTGHVWDEDLEELNNPLPRWWLVLFVLTVIFSIGYLFLYPGLGNYPGKLGWTQETQYETESQRLEARQAETFAKFEDMSIEEISTNPEAFATGRRIFANNCATCHGSDGRGAPGFPNLADDDWLYGNDGETVLASISNGRNGIMPPFQGTLGEQQIEDVAAYVYALGGKETNAKLEQKAARGAQTFTTFCAACHLANGTGNRALGAPNLTDDTWLYGGSLEEITRTIAQGRNGRMPAHKDLLGIHKRRLVAAYVLGLSGNEND